LLTGVYKAQELTDGYVPAEEHSSSETKAPSGETPLSGVESDHPHYFRSVAGIGQQVAQALAYAHARQIIHRDIKPSNLLLDAAGVVWVTDFGLAKTDDDGLTNTGDIVGTLRYMAPERFSGQGDARSDLYSLGLTLYELLALRPVFTARDRNKLLREVMDAEPARLRQLVPGLPRDLETIVHKAMARDPNDRYASAHDMAADLRRFVDDLPIKARRVSARERFVRWCRRNPIVAGLTGSVIAALVAVAVVLTVLAVHMSASADAALRAKLQSDRDNDALTKASSKLDQDKHDLETAATEKDKLVDRQQLLLGQQYVDNGVRSLDAGDYGEAALWFAQALDKDGANAERAAFHRQRLSNTLRACPRPLHIWFHDDDVSAEYSPDGRSIVSFSGRMVKLRDAATGKEIAGPLEHDGTVFRTIFSGSGARLTTLCRAPANTKPPTIPYAVVRVWDAHNGKPLTPPFHVPETCDPTNAEADRVAVSADGRSFQVWDVETGNFLGDPVAPADSKAVLVCLVMSRDGRRVLATVRTPSDGLMAKPQDWATTLWEPGRADPMAGPCEMRRPILSHDGRRFFEITLTSLEARELETGRLLWSCNTRGWSRFVQSPDGARILEYEEGIPQRERPTQLRDAATGELIAGSEVIRANTVSSTYQWSTDSRLLVASSLDGSLRAWDTKAFKEYGVPLHVEHLLPNMTRVSPDGQRLLTVHRNNAVRVWDIQTGFPLTPQLTHPEPVRSAQFSASGAEVLTVSGRAVYLWPLAAPPHGRVLDLEAIWGGKVEARSSDGRFLLLRTYAQVSGTQDKVALYRTATGERVSVTASPLIPPPSFSMDGKRLLLQQLNRSDGSIDFRLLDPERIDDAAPWCKADLPKRPNDLKPGLQPGFGLEFNHDGSRLLDHNTQSVVDPATGGAVGRFGPDDAERRSGWRFLLLSPDRRFTLWQNGDKHCQRRVTETREPAGALMSLDLAGILFFERRVSFSADGSRFVLSQSTGPDRSAVQVWDAVAGRPLTAQLSPPAEVERVALSPDGKLFLTVEKRGPVRVWETATGELALLPLAQTGTVSLARFSRDGKRIVTISSKSHSSFFMFDHPVWQLCVWEAATGRPLTPPLPYYGISNALTGNEDTLFDSEGTSAMRVPAPGTMELTDFSAGEGTLEEQRAFAEVLSARRLNDSGRPLALEEERFREGWKRFEARAWPAEARALLDPVRWHRGEAAGAMQLKPIDQRPGPGLMNAWVNADAALWHLDRLLALKPADLHGHQSRAQLHVAAKRWPEALADYTALIDAGVNYHRVARGDVSATMGKWQEAEADFEAAAEAEFYRREALERLALLRLRAGDKVGWRETCGKLGAEASEILLTYSRPGLGLKAITAGPDALTDWSFLDKRRSGVQVGALLFRQGGHDEDALRLLHGDPLSPVNPAALQFFRAMTLQRLNRTKEAAEALKNGREILKVQPIDAGRPWPDSSANWMEVVYAELLEREAASAIEGPKK
jgi:WD40 repeat protein/tetratricopeptide (TPR) repeat protein